MEVRSVFISFAEEDKKIAEDCKEELEKRKVGVWLYTRDIPHGNYIENDTVKALKTCDHLLIILSPASKRSEWVSRELGFIYHRQKKRDGLYPSIVGVRFNSDKEEYVLDVKDFYTKEKFDECEFGSKRCFDLKSGTADSFDDLAKHLKPSITHIDIDIDNPELLELLDNSFDCYEELFEENDRDDPCDIKLWLEENRGNWKNPWFEIWSILHIKNFPIGISFLTINQEFPFWYANYLAVRQDFRQLNRAKDFLEKVIGYARGKFPKAKGILFEIDRINIQLLEEVANSIVDKSKLDKEVRRNDRAFFQSLDRVIGSLPELARCDKKNVLDQIRALRRLWIYQHYPNTYILLEKETGKPISYWQPALSEPLNETNERPLHLMIHFFEGYTKKDFDLSEAMNFIYDNFYDSAYGDSADFSVKIKGYKDYLWTVRKRFETQLSKGWVLGEFPTSKNIKQLKRVLDRIAPKKIAL